MLNNEDIGSRRKIGGLIRLLDPTNQITERNPQKVKLLNKISHVLVGFETRETSPSSYGYLQVKN